MAPLSGGSAINFESSGTLVANLLSAAFLGFDKQGNLYGWRGLRVRIGVTQRS